MNCLQKRMQIVQSNALWNANVLTASPNKKQIMVHGFDIKSMLFLFLKRRKMDQISAGLKFHIEKFIYN